MTDTNFIKDTKILAAENNNTNKTPIEVESNFPKEFLHIISSQNESSIRSLSNGADKVNIIEGVGTEIVEIKNKPQNTPKVSHASATYIQTNPQVSKVNKIQLNTKPKKATITTKEERVENVKHRAQFITNIKEQYSREARKARRIEVENKRIKNGTIIKEMEANITLKETSSKQLNISQTKEKSNNKNYFKSMAEKLFSRLTKGNSFTTSTATSDNITYTTNPFFKKKNSERGR